MTTLSDLVARLEAEKEGSRELDTEIGRVVFGFDHIPNDNEPHLGTYNWTRSLDAALTLVKGYACVVRDEDGRGLVTLTPLDDTFQKGSEGATPALALCIAALKAREAGR